MCPTPLTGKEGRRPGSEKKKRNRVAQWVRGRKGPGPQKKKKKKNRGKCLRPPGAQRGGRGEGKHRDQHPGRRGKRPNSWAPYWPSGPPKKEKEKKDASRRESNIQQKGKGSPFRQEKKKKAGYSPVERHSRALTSRQGERKKKKK